MITRNRLFALFLLILSVFTGLGSFATDKPSSLVYVQEILDGDTIVVVADTGEVRVRLAQIDAPEKDQDFGLQSTLSLTELLRGKKVELIGDTKDRYGRLVAEVLLDGENINALQVKRGAAWVYTKYAHDQNLVGYEQTAKDDKLGLWASTDPMPPWEFRRRKK